MSAHYDKWLLNTYRSSPYFEAHIPADYRQVVCCS
jgi:hypothetical protein